MKVGSLRSGSSMRDKRHVGSGRHQPHKEPSAQVQTSRAHLTKPITRSDRNKNGNATNQTAKTRTLAPKMAEITDATDALLSVKQRPEFDLSVCGDAQ